LSVICIELAAKASPTSGAWRDHAHRWHVLVQARLHDLAGREANPAGPFSTVAQRRYRNPSLPRLILFQPGRRQQYVVALFPGLKPDVGDLDLPCWRHVRDLHEVVPTRRTPVDEVSTMDEHQELAATLVRLSRDSEQRCERRFEHRERFHAISLVIIP
jgi:hypothetical protein